MAVSETKAKEDFTGLLSIREILDIPIEKLGTGIEDVHVTGWISSVRKAQGGKLRFADVIDGSCTSKLQCVLRDIETRLAYGFCIRFRGRLIPSPTEGQDREFEVSDAGIVVYGTFDAGRSPIRKAEYTLEYLRDYPHFKTRYPPVAAILRVRHALAMATHRFFDEGGYFYIHTPIITSADCEGAGEAFSVVLPDEEAATRHKKIATGFPKLHTFFKRPHHYQAHLTVSGQLHVEPFACSMRRVYTFGPTFRAERSRTGRHLAEFWMLEPEVAFADLDEIVDVAEKYLHFVAGDCLRRCRDDLALIGGDSGEKLLRKIQELAEVPFVRVTYTEAIDLLQKAVSQGAITFEEAPEWGMDMKSEHEKYLCEVLFKGVPTVVAHYPRKIKAFYMYDDAGETSDRSTVASMDILFPEIGEVCGGSQREHRLEVLEAKVKEFGLDPRLYEWYTDLRKFGTVPHSGFGIGFSRVLRYLCGVDSIRDVEVYPAHFESRLF